MEGLLVLLVLAAGVFLLFKVSTSITRRACPQCRSMIQRAATRCPKCTSVLSS